MSVSAETAMASFGILLNSGVSYTWVTQSLNRQGMTPAITAAFSEGSNWGKSWRRAFWQRYRIIR